MFFYEFVIVILAMILGARYGGVFFGMCGGLGLLALILIFGLAPASPPIAVMLIMMSVVLAASTHSEFRWHGVFGACGRTPFEGVSESNYFCFSGDCLCVHVHGRYR